jgi:hypothetical protein
LSKVRGKLSCLVINDLDAGIGRFGNTQVGCEWGCCDQKGGFVGSSLRALLGQWIGGLCLGVGLRDTPCSLFTLSLAAASSPPLHTHTHQQVTVNNQIVIGTLMNICDDPNRVSVGAGWRENDTIRRVPIIVTGACGPVGKISEVFSSACVRVLCGGGGGGAPSAACPSL